VARLPVVVAPLTGSWEGTVAGTASTTSHDVNLCPRPSRVETIHGTLLLHVFFKVSQVKESDVGNLPLSLRWYLWLLFLASVALIVGQVWLWPPVHPTRVLPLEAVLFVALTYLGEHTVVRISKAIALTLATTMHVAMILLFPLPIPILVALLASLLSGLHDTAYPLYKRAFNVAHEVCTVGVCSLAFALIARPSGAVRPAHFVAMLPVFILVLILYYVLDVGLVIGVLSLIERRSPWAAWQETYRRTLLPEWAASSIGILAAEAWTMSPVVLALFVVPVVALHVAFKAIAQEERRSTAFHHVLTAAERLQRLEQRPVDLLHEVAAAALAIATAVDATTYIYDPEDPAQLKRVAVVSSTATVTPGPASLPAPPSSQGPVIDGNAHTVTLPFDPEGTGVIGLVLLSGAPADIGTPGYQALAILATHATQAWRNVLMHERVVALASEDGLTGLLNHRSFHKRLEEEAARIQRMRGPQEPEPLALVMVDLDNFGQINNTHGHQGGDVTLVAVATALRESGRASDLPARYGGDEFALILPQTEMDEALAIAERVRGAITGLRIVYEGAIIRLNASIGVAILPLHATTPPELIRAADQAVYLAKHAGKGRIGRPEDALLAQGHDLAALATQLEHANVATVEALAAAVDAKDPYTRGHSRRVSDYGAAVAYALGWPPEDIARVRRAGLLHDVGKIGVPDAILTKAGPLTTEEFAVIKEHPVVGEMMLSAVPHLREVLPSVRHHHERWDGRGYPDGLAGAAIPPDAAVLMVVDAFDAMTSSRTYRHALPIREARRRLREGSGTQFDARIVAAFEQALSTGTLQLPPLLQARDTP